MGQTDALVQSLGEFVDAPVHNVVQSAQVDQLADPGNPLALVHAADSGNIVQIVIDQHAVVKRCRFRQVSHHLFDLDQMFIQQIVFDANGSGSRHKVAREHSQGRGFSGAVWA